MEKRKARLYIDESGDHTFRKNCIGIPDKQYLCLFGSAIEINYYTDRFVPAINKIKKDHFDECLPDEAVILHREEMVRFTGPFACLKNPAKATAFRVDFLKLVRETDFRAFSALVNKAAIINKNYGFLPSHPYHIGFQLILERYCGWLKFTGRIGDVMVESRGGAEDLTLKEAYKVIFKNGTKYYGKDFFQNHLTSGELKLKKKEHNVLGLQLSDLLAYPSRCQLLCDIKKKAAPTGTTATIASELEKKYNRRFANQEVIGYGKIFVGC